MGIGWILPWAGNHFARLRRFAGHGLRCDHGSWNLPARLACEGWGLHLQHCARAPADGDGCLARASSQGPPGFIPIAQTMAVLVPWEAAGDSRQDLRQRRLPLKAERQIVTAAGQPITPIAIIPSDAPSIVPIAAAIELPSRSPAGPGCGR